MHWNIFASPAELTVTALAVTLVGLSKGGLGGMSLLGVPLMALVMPPVTAAAILLPVLVVMDLVSLTTWRRWVDWRIMRQILPGASVGVGVGWATVGLVSDSMVRLIVGIVSVVFIIRALTGARMVVTPMKPSAAAARVWGGLAGYTSFVAHAGAPPLQIYMMPLRLDPKLFTGTTVMFFAATNGLKLIPYAALGEFDAANLTSAAAMVPLAAAATWCGGWVVRHMRASVFYPFTYVSVAVVGLKLIWDGLTGL